MEDYYNYKIDIKSENDFRVLYRIIGLLTKRRIIIKRIDAYEKEGENLLIIYIVVNVRKSIIDNLVKFINKVIEIKEIKYNEIDF